VLPRRRLTYKDQTLEEMDLDALIARQQARLLFRRFNRRVGIMQPLSCTANSLGFLGFPNQRIPFTTCRCAARFQAGILRKFAETMFERR
jgi:hypothetical protein